MDKLIQETETALSKLLTADPSAYQAVQAGWAEACYRLASTLATLKAIKADETNPIKRSNMTAAAAQHIL